MPVIEESVVIDRTVADVFRFMSDVTKVTMYDASVVLSSQEGEGEIGVGTRWRGVTRILGRDFGWVAECVEFEPDRSIMIMAVQGKVQFETRTLLSREGDGTRIDYRVSTAKGLGGIFGRLADSFVNGVQARTIKTNLATLKEILETHSE